ncbi:response regulator [Azospirillum thermophilum]|uniref:Response regulator n=1 Tax=Azospirillum thermophilum TaxID=2202148 RepID=A0A2S2CKT8_9PROT|nr:response regulator [Azospirillum thermophilum]AWK85104.1 response regulator [Azospirillum thermophilum]
MSATIRPRSIMLQADDTTQSSSAAARRGWIPIPSRSRTPGRSRPLRLLVVEDEAISAEAIRLAVCDLGHVVCGTAATEEEAVAIASRDRPDLALMDVRLAGGDGIEAARRLNLRYGIRSIFLSGYADHGIMARITETYPLGIVHKPFSPSQLKTALDLAARRLR